MLQRLALDPSSLPPTPLYNMAILEIRNGKYADALNDFGDFKGHNRIQHHFDLFVRLYASQSTQTLTTTVQLCV